MSVVTLSGEMLICSYVCMGTSSGDMLIYSYVCMGTSSGDMLIYSYMCMGTVVSCSFVVMCVWGQWCHAHL